MITFKPGWERGAALHEMEILRYKYQALQKTVDRLTTLVFMSTFLLFGFTVVILIALAVGN